jgi:hypothetical protein
VVSRGRMSSSAREIVGKPLSAVKKGSIMRFPLQVTSSVADETV